MQRESETLVVPEGTTKVSEVLKMPVDDLTTEEAYEAHWKRMAHFLLNDVVVMIKGRPFRLLEIEFYFTNATHDDPYTHCTEGLDDIAAVAKRKTEKK